ncbi:MAG TPA: DUF4097 family beta strand repeat-containing protein [Candidatus Acidoferrum sp.]|nr:DUF4097 family beta strand repeat-containing protein [Candidatus Acidoferrum sp.]
MNRRRPGVYHRSVMATTWRRGLAGLLSVFVFLAGMTARAHAASALIPTTPAPFVWIQLESGAVTIRTWDRPAIQIQSDPSVRFSHAPPRDVGGRAPQQIPLWSQTVRTPAGDLTLAPEAFILPSFPPGEHDALVVRGEGDVTLTIPTQTALVLANVRLGSVAVDSFAGTALVAHVTAGEVHLNNVSTTAAVQVNNGPVFISNSDFPRLRLRTGRGNVFMDNCRASQIQVTSLVGSILFDDGTFDPGLAHFETDRGSIAIGVTSGAQIDAHSSAGRIFYDIGNEGNINRSPNDAQAMLNGGGPVVTASSVDGAVLFYRGTLHQYPQLERIIGPKLRRAQEQPPFQQQPLRQRALR